MRIRNKNVSVVFKLAIAAIGLIGICLQTGLIGNGLNIQGFRMFTNLSNLLCVIYFATAGFSILSSQASDGGQVPAPELKACCQISITLTALVAAVLMRDLLSFSSLDGFSMILLHIVNPVMIILDWLLFDEKGYWDKTYPWKGLIFPALYFVYIILTAQWMDKDDTMRFPYTFLDYESLGIGNFLLAILILATLIIGMGYLYVFLDVKMKKN